MYAIIETGSKQYRVEEGDEINVELLEAEQNVTFKALFVNDGQSSHIGQPYVPHCSVHAELLGETKGKKEVAYKYKQRKISTRRLVGHRQKYSRIKITKISLAA